MIYDHIVKYEGIYYRAGEDVPDVEVPKKTKPSDKQDGKENK